ncbi:MAG TPA: hypothetical protein P5287_02690 [bacterium]|nr:hypothetical protein [bacterium]
MTMRKGINSAISAVIALSLCLSPAQACSQYDGSTLAPESMFKQVEKQRQQQTAYAGFAEDAREGAVWAFKTAALVVFYPLIILLAPDTVRNHSLVKKVSLFLISAYMASVTLFWTSTVLGRQIMIYAWVRASQREAARLARETAVTRSTARPAAIEYERTTAVHVPPGWLKDVDDFIARQVVPREARIFNETQSAGGMSCDRAALEIKNEKDQTRLGPLKLEMAPTARELYTASSKEAVHIAYLLGIATSKPALAGVKLEPAGEEQAALSSRGLPCNDITVAKLRLIRKLQTHKQYGKMLPWVGIGPDGTITPKSDFIPSLDNGEASWSIAAIIGGLGGEKDPLSQELVALAGEVLKLHDYAPFFNRSTGLLYAEINKDMTQKGGYELNDMCEGTMAVLWAVLHGQVPESAWDNIKITTVPYVTAGGETIDALQGYRGSLHELWPLGWLPLMDSPLAPLYKNHMYAQLDLANRRGLPGVGATCYTINGYRQIGPFALASMPGDREDVATAYATAMLMLIDREVGAKWFANLYAYPGMSGNYGIVESVAPDGYGNILTTDSKGLIITSLMGGLKKEVKEYLTSRTVPGTNVTMYDRMKELLARKYRQLMDARKGVPLRTFTKPYPAPAKDQMTVAVKPLPPAAKVTEVTKLLQPEHHHGLNVADNWQRSEGGIVLDYRIAEGDRDQFAWKGTFIKPMSLYGMKYLSVTIPADTPRYVFNIEFKNSLRSLPLAIAQDVSTVTEENVVLSLDGKTKTIVTPFFSSEKSKDVPCDYVSLSLADPKARNNPREGRIEILDIKLTREYPMGVSGEAVRRILDIPGREDILPSFAWPHGGLVFRKDRERGTILFTGEAGKGGAWRGGYVAEPIPLGSRYAGGHVSIVVRARPDAEGAFTIELKNEGKNLFGRNVRVTIPAGNDWQVVQVPLPDDKEMLLNYIALSEPSGQFELAAITFDAGQGSGSYSLKERRGLASAKAEYMQVNAPFYSVESVKDGKPVKFADADEAKSFGEELVAAGRAEKHTQLEVLGRKFDIIIEKGAGFNAEMVKALISEAVNRTKEAGGDILKLPSTLVFAILDSSTHLFEDHIANGFIGISRAVNDIADVKLRTLLLKIGLFHELCHEATGQQGTAFEAAQLPRDVQFAVSAAVRDLVEIERLAPAIQQFVTPAFRVFHASVEAFKPAAAARQLLPPDKQLLFADLFIKAFDAAQQTDHPDARRFLFSYLAEALLDERRFDDALNVISEIEEEAEQWFEIRLRAVGALRADGRTADAKAILSDLVGRLERLPAATGKEKLCMSTAAQAVALGERKDAERIIGMIEQPGYRMLDALAELASAGGADMALSFIRDIVPAGDREQYRRLIAGPAGESGDVQAVNGIIASLQDGKARCAAMIEGGCALLGKGEEKGGRELVERGIAAIGTCKSVRERLSLAADAIPILFKVGMSDEARRIAREMIGQIAEEPVAASRGAMRLWIAGALAGTDMAKEHLQLLEEYDAEVVRAAAPGQLAAMDHAIGEFAKQCVSVGKLRRAREVVKLIKDTDVRADVMQKIIAAVAMEGNADGAAALADAVAREEGAGFIHRNVGLDLIDAGAVPAAIRVLRDAKDDSIDCLVVSKIAKSGEFDAARRIADRLEDQERANAYADIAVAVAGPGRISLDIAERYRLWNRSGIVYNADIVAAYLRAPDPRTYITQIKQRGAELIRKGFDPKDENDRFYAYVGACDAGIMMTFAEFNERMDVIADYDRFHPGTFRSLFLKDRGLAPFDLTAQGARTIDPLSFDPDVLDAHLNDLLAKREMIDSLTWTEGMFPGVREFSLRTLYYLLKRREAAEAGLIGPKDKFNVAIPDDAAIEREIERNPKLFYRAVFEKAKDMLSNPAYRDRCALLMSYLIVADCMQDGGLVAQLRASEPLMKVSAFKMLYDDYARHLPDAVGAGLKQYPAVFAELKKLSAPCDAELAKVRTTKAAGVDTYRLVPQGFLCLFRGRAGITDCSFDDDRSKGKAYTRAMHEDTKYYFIYNSRGQLKGYVGLMVAEDPKLGKVLTVDTVNTPSFMTEEIHRALFTELQNVARSLGCVPWIAVPYETQESFNFDNRLIVEKMPEFRNGEMLKDVRPVNADSWDEFTAEYGPDKYNSIETGEFMLLPSIPVAAGAITAGQPVPRPVTGTADEDVAAEEHVASQL